MAIYGAVRVIQGANRTRSAVELRLWMGIAAACVLGLLGAALTARPFGLHVASLLVGIAGIFSAASITAFLAHRLAVLRRGHAGGRVVCDLLSPLPDDYLLVTDVPIGRALEHVLVGPCGVVLVEPTDWTGTVRCQGDAWFVNGRSARSLSRRARSRAAAVREFLQRALPDLGAAPFVESIVVFTDPDCRLEMERSRTFAVRRAELDGFLSEFARRIQMPPHLTGRVAGAFARSALR